ncbi:MAG TPA: PHB depolymerase family esterase [Gammaproteobacteria bacterium]|nr:PHB depolymerase family esterase [Gammaproteobacteria bacterium]
MRVAAVVAALAAAVALWPVAQAQSADTSPSSACALRAAAGVAEQKLMSDGRERTYRLFVPPSYDGRASLPLVLDLHGSGGTAERQAGTSRFEALAASEGFAVATLQAGAEGNRWNVPVTADRPDDVQYVSDVIDHVAARVCTDRTRVYATGFSGGARMSSLLACRLNDRIAAIAPMAGLRWPGPCQGRAIPVLTFHGLADPQNTYDGHVEQRGLEWLESVPDALAGWARHNRCAGEAVLDDPPGPLSTLSYRGCRAEVRLVRVDGLVHRWARDEVDATAAMWEFFRSHSL